MSPTGGPWGFFVLPEGIGAPVSGRNSPGRLTVYEVFCGLAPRNFGVGTLKSDRKHRVNQVRRGMKRRRPRLGGLGYARIVKPPATRQRAMRCRGLDGPCKEEES